MHSVSLYSIVDGNCQGDICANQHRLLQKSIEAQVCCVHQNLHALIIEAPGMKVGCAWGIPESDRPCGRWEFK